MKLMKGFVPFENRISSHNDEDNPVERKMLYE